MKRWFTLIISIVALVGCSASGSTKPTGPLVEAQTPVRRDEGIVIAEGAVVPARSSTLSFTLPGDVVQVWVKEGDRVEAGVLMVKLDTRQLELSLRSAEQDIIAQEAALQQLLNGTSDQVIARADKANRDQIDQAEVVLSLQQLQLEQAQAEDPAVGVAAAQARLSQLQLTLAQAQAQNPTPSVTVAEVTLERARIALEDTQNEYNKALDRPWEEQAIRDAWADRLEQAQLDYKAAQAQLESAQNAQKAHQIGLGVLAAQIAEVRTGLDNALIAQETYTISLQMLEAEVRAAELSLDALKTWDNPYRDQPSDEEVAQLRAVLEKTKLGVETLKVQLEDAELVAPFAGTVVKVDVEVGDAVSVGQMVVVLATLEQLEIRTVDLTELDIGGVVEGQAVEVTVDALPGQAFAGVVSEIALQGQDYRGDVVYEVVVLLDDPAQASALRWGMTTMVEIKAR